MAHQQTEKLAKEPVGRLFLKLAIPGVAAQLVMLVNNIVDRIWVGHIDGCGALALTAVGICMPILLAFLSLAMMVGSGASPRMSIFLGKQDREGAERTLGTSLWFILVASVASMVVIYAFTDELILLFGGSSQSMPYARSYLLTSGWGVLFQFLSIGLTPMLYAQGLVKKGMQYTMIAMSLNIVLDPVFIFALNLGVMGAALATNISMIVSTLLIVARLADRTCSANIRLKFVRLMPMFLMPCLILGLSSCAALVCESLALMLYNQSLVRLDGDVAVGAMAVFNIILSTDTMIMLGLSIGAQPIISYNYGAGENARVRQVLSLTLWTSLAVSVLVWLLVMLFPAGTMSLFTDDASFVAYGSSYVHVFFALAMLIGVNQAVQYNLRALDKAIPSLMLGLFRRIILLIPLIWLLPRLMPEHPVTAIYATAPAVEVLTLLPSLFFHFKMRKQFS